MVSELRRLVPDEDRVTLGVCKGESQDPCDGILGYTKHPHEWVESLYSLAIYTSYVRRCFTLSGSNTHLLTYCLCRELLESIADYDGR